MQAKHVDENVVLIFLAEQYGPSTQFKTTAMPSIGNLMSDVPVGVLLAKLRAMSKKGLIKGCGCGCRGDWVITELGKRRVIELIFERGGHTPTSLQPN